MRTLMVLPCIILLAPVAALPQFGPASMMVFSHTQPASAGGDAKLLADFLEGQVTKLLMDKYPCAQPTRASDVSNVLDHNRQRELLGTDTEEDMNTLAGSLGVKYLVSLTVTQMGSGQFAMSASMMSAGTAQSQARSGTVAGGGEAAFDAAEAFAKQFVDSLGSLSQFSKSNCEPTNPWTGTITYKLLKNDDKNDSRKTGDQTGTISSTYKTSIDYDVSIKIGWTGRPQATIIANELSNSEEVGEKRIDCSRATIAKHPPEWKSAGWDFVTRIKQNAYDNVVASVSVVIEMGRYKLNLSVPEIRGTTTYTEHKHADGGCGKPSDKDQGPLEMPWRLQILFPPVDNPLQKPDQIQGRDTDYRGGILTWNLTRTPMRK
jgi:hypothetical protein